MTEQQVGVDAAQVVNVLTSKVGLLMRELAVMEVRNTELQAENDRLRQEQAPADPPPLKPSMTPPTAVLTEAGPAGAPPS